MKNQQSESNQETPFFLFQMPSAIAPSAKGICVSMVFVPVVVANAGSSRAVASSTTRTTTLVAPRGILPRNRPKPKFYPDQLADCTCNLVSGLPPETFFHSKKPKLSSTRPLIWLRTNWQAK